MSGDDARHMAHALGLGARGLGQTWPNPSVGCVIVNAGRVVGRGRTATGGRPHAETQALDMAGANARGATVYVTLEPCAHQGQTPPCSDALIRAGVARVVIPLTDPDARVSGKGVERLRQAGITVDIGCMADAARAQHAGFLSRVTKGRPSVTLKLAATLDGRIATASGESQWITGAEARADVHRSRAMHDAILVGAGTARTDLPSLTVRTGGIAAQPVRIVASRHLRLPQEGPLFETANTNPVWLVCGDKALGSDEAEAWEKAGAKLFTVATDDGQISPLAMLSELGNQGLTRVYCEGGGMLAASLLSHGLVDELVVYGAGKLIGAEGQPSVGPLGLSSLDRAPAFDLVDISAIGADVRQTWRPRYLNTA